MGLMQKEINLWPGIWHIVWLLVITEIRCFFLLCLEFISFPYSQCSKHLIYFLYIRLTSTVGPTTLKTQTYALRCPFKEKLSSIDSTSNPLQSPRSKNCGKMDITTYRLLYFNYPILLADVTVSLLLHVITIVIKFSFKTENFRNKMLLLLFLVFFVGGPEW